MLVDEKGRLFGKINVIDLLIILVIIAAIVFGISKTIEPQAVESDTNTIELKFYSEEVSDFVASNVAVGEPVIDANTMVELGDIKSVEVGPSDSYGTTSEGKIVKTTKDNYNSMLITTEVQGEVTPHGCKLKDNEYSIGHTLTIRAGKAKIYLRVYDVQAKEQ